MEVPCNHLTEEEAMKLIGWPVKFFDNRGHHKGMSNGILISVHRGTAMVQPFRHRSQPNVCVPISSLQLWRGGVVQHAQRNIDKRFA